MTIAESVCAGRQASHSVPQYDHIGDGLTDVPCMKLVKTQTAGNPSPVYQKTAKRKRSTRFSGTAASIYRAAGRLLAARRHFLPPYKNSS
jgi:hypothetical protein